MMPSVCACQYSGLRDGRALGGGTRFPTRSSDLATEGIQMRCGRPAELAIQENFGRLSASPLRVGKTRLCGLQCSSRLRSHVLRADQSDTGAYGLLAQAQQVTPN